MAKIRVFEVAKQLSVTSKDVMNVLKEIGVEVTSHQSGIDETTAQKAVQILIKRSVKKDASVKKEAAVTIKNIQPTDDTRNIQIAENETQKQAAKKDDTVPVKKSSQKPTELNTVEVKQEKIMEQKPKVDSVKKDSGPVKENVSQQKSYSDKNSDDRQNFRKDNSSQQRPFGDRNQSNDRQGFRRDSQQGQQRSYGDRNQSNDRQGFKRDSQQGQQRPFGDRNQSNDRQGFRRDSQQGQQRPFGDRNSDDRQGFRRDSQQGQQRPFGDRNQSNDRQGFRRDSQQGQQRPFGDRNQSNDRQGFRRDSQQGQQRPFGDRNQSNDRQGFRRDSQQGQQRPFGDRNQSNDRQGFKRDFQQGRSLQGFMDKDKDAAPRQERRSGSQRSKSSSSFELPVIMQKPNQGQKQNNRQHSEKKEQQMTSKGRMLIQQGGIKPPSSKKRNEPKKEVVETPKAIEVALPITIGELASLLDIKPGDILRKLLENGRMLAINHSLDKELIYFILDLFELEHDKIIFMEDIESDEEEDDDPDSLEERPPVVTILGHVDHGKTSLLDAIRKTNVTAGEAGGITQKIGAYVVNHDGKKIVFVDTPGHEAFTAMRARGAQVTDIAILVVAADDGVMPQTIEAINHAKAAKVPIIVAINKIDKPGANVDRVKQQLSEQGLTPDDWGGDATCVPVSAKSKIGLDELLDMILLVADMQELKANPKRKAYGIILESRLDKGLGCMATVLVQKGTLKPGDAVIAGLVSGKVRLLINENGEKVKKATPSIPVEIVGLTDLPNAGDVLMAVKDDKMARQISDERQTRDRERHLVSGPKTTLQDIFKGLSEGEKKELDVLIKADSNGSVEAIKHSLAKLPDDEVKVNIVHGAVGSVSESDVLLAKTSAHPLIIGFNIKVESNIRKLADQEKVNIRTYDVIYHMIEDIQAAMKGMLEPEYEHVLIGKAEVRQIFKASKVGIIAGSCVISGKITRNAEVKIYRKNKMIHEGEIESLKRFKDDAKEVLEGFECGISIENFNDLQEGDIIEAYQLKEKER